MSRGLEILRQAPGLSELEKAKSDLLGRESALGLALRGLKGLSPEEKTLIGSAANAARQTLDEEVRLRREALSGRPKQALDLTLPGRRPPRGGLHPVTRAMEEMKAIFLKLGFQSVEGPEIEDEFHNFEALNTPADHPARDSHDSFYLEGGGLLRTHTSPVQIRVMEAGPPPVRIVAAGRAYRRDAADAGHLPSFHQVEGLCVDEGIRLSDLKGVVSEFARQFFGPKTKTRLRVSYFPFVEPGMEMDISCTRCKGEGCPLCKKSGWVEVGGMGMVHPKVFRAVDYDPDKVTGFAFGFGVERLAALRWEVPDIRLFVENDVRFLSSF